MQDVGKRVVQVNDCRVPSCIWQNGKKKAVFVLTHYLLNTFSEGNEAFVDEKFQEAVQVLYCCCVDVEICPKISFARISRRSLM